MKASNARDRCLELFNRSAIWRASRRRCLPNFTAIWTFYFHLVGTRVYGISRLWVCNYTTKTYVILWGNTGDLMHFTLIVERCRRSLAAWNSVHGTVVWMPLTRRHCNDTDLAYVLHIEFLVTWILNLNITDAPLSVGMCVCPQAVISCVLLWLDCGEIHPYPETNLSGESISTDNENRMKQYHTEPFSFYRVLLQRSTI